MEVFGSQYVVSQALTYQLSEAKMSLSGDSFNVSDENGNKVFEVDGGIRNKTRMVLKDLASKETLATIGQNGDEHTLKKGKSDQVLYTYKVQEGFDQPNAGQTKMEIYYGGASGAYPQMYVTRVIDENTFMLMESGKNTELARIQKTLRQSKRDFWACTANAGTDMAFVIATACILDNVLE